MAKSKRPIRAFGDVPSTDRAELQHSGAKGGDAARQNAVTGEEFHDGGNSSGRTMSGVDSYMVPAFQGKSGQPDNQSIHRPKGST